MKVHDYIPVFKNETRATDKTSLHSFRTLYREKERNPEDVKILYLYGRDATIRSLAVHSLFREILSPGTPAAAGASAAFVNIVNGATPADLIGQIMMQLSTRHGFTFPLTELCIYLTRRCFAADPAFAVDKRIKFWLSLANLTAGFPMQDYLRHTLDTISLDDESLSIFFINSVLSDNNAPPTLKHLAENREKIIKSIFSWSQNKGDPLHHLGSGTKEKMKSRNISEGLTKQMLTAADYFGSLFALDISVNLSGHTKPLVLFLNDIDNFWGPQLTFKELTERKGMLFGPCGLFVTTPHTFWVLSGRERMSWGSEFDGDWKDALIQQPLTMTGIKKVKGKNLEAILNDSFWNQHRHTLEQKIRTVLAILGIYNESLAETACRELIAEYYSAPGFATECQEIIQSVMTPDENNSRTGKSSRLSRGMLHYYAIKDTPFSEYSKWCRFKIFYIAQNYYSGCINSAASCFAYRRTAKNKQNDQVHYLEELIHSAAALESVAADIKDYSLKLRDFYYTAIIPQILDWIDLGLYSEAEMLLKKIHHYASEFSALSDSASSLGYAYLNMVRDGRIAKAVSKVEDIYRLNVSYSGEEDPTSVYLLNMLGYMRDNLTEQKDESYRERRKCASILRHALGRTDKYVLRQISLLAPHLCSIGRNHDALTVTEICYENAKRLYGEQDNITLNCLSNYAWRLMDTDRFETSATLFALVRKANENAYGNYNIRTIRALNNEAVSLKDSKFTSFEEDVFNYDLDESLQNRELELRQKLFFLYLEILKNEPLPKNSYLHPNILKALLNLCDTMCDGGSYDDAVSFVSKHVGQDNLEIITLLIRIADRCFYPDSVVHEKGIEILEQGLAICQEQGTGSYAWQRKRIDCVKKLDETIDDLTQDNLPGTEVFSERPSYRNNHLSDEYPKLIELAEKNNDPILLADAYYLYAEYLASLCDKNNERSVNIAYYEQAQEKIKQAIKHLESHPSEDSEVMLEKYNEFAEDLLWAQDSFFN